MKKKINYRVTPTEVEKALEEVGTKVQYNESNGFTKMNTNFYVVKGEELKFAVLDPLMYAIKGHSVQRKSKNGKTYWTVESCQKSMQPTCVYCDESKSNEAVSDARTYFYILILDFRGTKDKEGEWDYIPAPKFYQLNAAVAGMYNDLYKLVGDEITQIELSTKKDTNSHSTIVPVMTGGIKPEYVMLKDDLLFKGTLPEFGDLYEPFSDENAAADLKYV